ncbi:MAG: efflux transporter periplasmic adaptor subunit [Chlamydiales bacterium]|jgi:membrane fusion protein (multidrug efflux system)|nr:efflux transporter periplasmic adaptor subunit [Chlamydiales bacterium]
MQNKKVHKFYGFYLIAILYIFPCSTLLAKEAISISEQDSTVEAISVNIWKVQPVKMENSLTEIATLKSPLKIDIAVEVSGKVIEIYCDEGDFVQKGDILIQLDNRIAIAQKEQAEAKVLQTKAALQKAQTNYQRKEFLFSKQAVSDQEYTDAKDNLVIAEAALSEANAALDIAIATVEKYTIIAPFAGLITRRQVEVGTLINPQQQQQPLLTVEKVDVLHAETFIPESMNKWLSKGMLCSVLIYEDNYQGKVYRISPAINPETRTVKVEVAVENKDYKIPSGSFGRVTFLFGSEGQMIAIPVQSLVKGSEGRYYVFIVQEKQERMIAQKREVQVGKTANGWVEIKKGIEIGEIAATFGASKLADGASVIPLEIKNLK